MTGQQPATRRHTLLWLALSAALFLAWVGYLGFLVATTHHPVVLSRPQLLVADLDVVARVDDPDGPVAVVSVPWAGPGQPSPPEGTSIRVTNLKQCLVDREETREDALPKGVYLLPLRRAGDDFEVAPTAASPGYPPHDPILPRSKEGPPRIYRATPTVLEQLKQIHPS
jgi:hypothetical protein